MDDRWITSVGIDIGTSTTKMIVSRLKLMRTSGTLSLPRYDIVERELLYASPIYGTPLRSGDEIDAERIWSILEGEYRQAGITQSDLKTGAIIITGETANKKNASVILHKLAERSGDFVVATAGADLEALLAGRGAGADRRSMRTRGAVVNIDIGGGTANAALFQRGKLAGTVTFHVGGRLIQITGSGRIEAVSPSIRPWLHVSGYRLEAGQQVTFAQLKDVCASMCRVMIGCLAGRASAEEPAGREALRALTLGAPLPFVPFIEEWTVSGGIGMLLGEAEPASLAETAVHGDIGPLLAAALKERFAQEALKLVPPDQTVRATVIGAGMQSAEISGATAHLDAALLPIRNLPVLKFALKPSHLDDPSSLGQALAQTLQAGASLYDPDASPPFALALSGLSRMTYTSLQSLSGLLSEHFANLFPNSRAMVVVCENDIAKALGQSLERHCGGQLKIVCIDQIKVEHGDYIDLGEPISGAMIPVVVKTLAFEKTIE